MSGPPRVSLAEFADTGTMGGPLLAADGAVREPLVAVDLAGEPDGMTLERAMRHARDADQLMIGMLPADSAARPPADLLEALDLTLTGPETGADRTSVAVADPEETLRVLSEAVTRNAQASLVLRGVLRTTPLLPAGTALDIESYAYSTLLGGPEFARWLADRGPAIGTATARAWNLIDA